MFMLLMICFVREWTKCWCHYRHSGGHSDGPGHSGGCGHSSDCCGAVLQVQERIRLR